MNETNGPSSPPSRRLVALQSSRVTASNFGGLSFGKRLNSYLTQLRMVQSELAEAIDEKSRVTISNWVSDRRLPGREQVIKIAKALDQRLTELRNRDHDAEDDERFTEVQKSGTVSASVLPGHDLGTLLSDLLQAAGFGFSELPQDVAWSRLAGSEKAALRIGYVHDFYLAADRPKYWTGRDERKDQLAPDEPTNRAADDERKDRIALDISKLVTTLLGAGYEGVPFRTWGRLINNVQAGTVDLAAPILAISPYHLRRVSFSDSIGLMLRHVCVLTDVQCKKYNIGESDRLSPGLMERLNFIRTGDGVSEMFADLGRQESVPLMAESEADIIHRLLDDEHPADINPCAIMGKSVAVAKVQEFQGRLTLHRLPYVYDVPLSLGFAIPRNEPQLLRAVNVAVGTMKQTGMLRELYLSYGNGNVEEAEKNLGCEIEFDILHQGDAKLEPKLGQSAVPDLLHKKRMTR